MYFFNEQKVCYERWGISEYSENLDKIINLRKTYKHFPYLYSYDEMEEQDYHNAYMTAGEALDAFVAIHDGNLVGISIGCPLRRGITICSDLVDTELNEGNPYYFGDIIIDRNYWGQGISNILYQKHIEHVSEKEHSHVLALLVERDDDDPRKPSGFKKSNLWSSHQFHPTDYITTYPWNTFTISGEIKQEEHTFRAYRKIISPTKEATLAGTSFHV